MFVFEGSTGFGWNASKLGPRLESHSCIKWARPSGHMEGGASWGGKMRFRIHKMGLFPSCPHLAVLDGDIYWGKSQFSYLQSGCSNPTIPKCFILQKSYSTLLSLAASAFYMYRRETTGTQRNSALFYEKCQKSVVLMSKEACILWGSRVREVTSSQGSSSLCFWPAGVGAPVKHQERNVSQVVLKKYVKAFFSSGTLVWIYNPQTNHWPHLCHFQLVFYAKDNSATGCWYQVNLDSTWEVFLVLLVGEPVGVSLLFGHPRS